MAGRDRYPPLSSASANSLRLHEVPPSRTDSDLNPGRIHVSIIQDRIETQHRKIQTLLADNQRLAATHMALKQELAASKQELQHFLEAARKVKAERDVQLRQVYQKSLKVEAEARVIDVQNTELDQVRKDVLKLTATKQELAADLEAIDVDLIKAKSDSQRVLEIKAEIETVLTEIQKGRAAIELEKKTRNSNLQHKLRMEKRMGLLAQEIEKLQAELAEAENRTRAATAACKNPGYAANYGNPERAYGGRLYPEPYSMPQVWERTDSLPQQQPGTVQHIPYEAHQSNVPP